MKARDLLQRARERSITLSAEGGKVIYRARRGAMTPELRAAIVSHRDQVIALLESDKVPRRRSGASPWPDHLPLLGGRRVTAFAPCSGCGEGSWVQYGETALCLACALKAETDEHAGPVRPSGAEALKVKVGTWDDRPGYSRRLLACPRVSDGRREADQVSLSRSRI
jgi:hypothetical protein